MVVLGLDTTTARGGVALMRDGTLVGALEGDAEQTHGVRLPGDIDRLLTEVGILLPDVDVYAVAAGPGGFTGLRVGMATIQALALVHAKPVVPVNALEAIARAGAAAGAEVSAGDLVAVWMDAHRGEVFTALYRWTCRLPDDASRARQAVTCPLDVLEPPAVGAPTRTLERWASWLGSSPVLFLGDGTVRYGASLPERSVTWSPLDSLAPMVARIGAVEAPDGRAVSPHRLRPVYVRRPDAELARARLASS